jgi:ABC-2 type transport system permease protein
MKNFLAIYKKELRTYFKSPIAYVVLAIFLVLAGFFFYNNFAAFNYYSMQAMQSRYGAPNLNITEWVLRPLFGNISITLIFLVPLLTMRLFSEEKKSGTIEMLFTYPIRDSEAILGKFASALTVFCLMIVLTGLYPLLMWMFGTVESGPLLSGYLGLLFLGAAFLSVGVFASSLTENQIVAAVITFGTLLFFWIIGWSSMFAGGKIADLLNYLSIIEHFDSFSKGMIDTKDIVYYLSFSFFALFLTVRTLESKKWRG